MQQQQIRENKMKKGMWALSAATLLVMSTPVQAKQEICVFDLLGKAGESYKLVEEWKLASKTWQGDIELIPYQDEEKAERVICAELAGDFHLGYARQLTDKSSLLFDLAF